MQEDDAFLVCQSAVRGISRVNFSSGQSIQATGMRASMSTSSVGLEDIWRLTEARRMAGHFQALLQLRGVYGKMLSCGPMPITEKACSELKMPLLFRVTVSMESQSYLRM